MRAKVGAILCLCILLVALCVVAFGFGAYQIPYSKMWNLLFTQSNESMSQVVLFERGIRICAAVCVGSALALSGGLYQGIIGNPLVSPSILGVLSGASFGAALGMLFGCDVLGIELLCFGFGIVAMGVSVLLAWLFDRRTSIVMLILGGMISSAFFGAALSVMKLVADPYNTLPNIVFWLMGSLAHVHGGMLAVLGVICCISCCVSFLLARSVDVLSLDEESAQALGVNIRRMRLCFIVMATLLASACVAVAGIVGWVGLVIPHIARFVVGASHRFMLPFCALSGGAFLLVCDTLARSLFAVEIPLGIVSAVVGIPIFVVLLGVRARAHG